MTERLQTQRPLPTLTHLGLVDARQDAVNRQQEQASLLRAFLGIGPVALAQLQEEVKGLPQALKVGAALGNAVPAAESGFSTFDPQAPMKDPHVARNIAQAQGPSPAGQLAQAAGQGLQQVRQDPLGTAQRAITERLDVTGNPLGFAELAGTVATGGALAARRGPSVLKALGRAATDRRMGAVPGGGIGDLFDMSDDFPPVKRNTGPGFDAPQRRPAPSGPLSERLDRFAHSLVDELDDPMQLSGEEQLRLQRFKDLRAFIEQNLPTVVQERLARAIDQGLDVTAYHGTKGIIDPGFDPEYAGATTGAPSAYLGHFFAGKPATANAYAAYADPRKLGRADVIESFMKRQDEIIAEMALLRPKIMNKTATSLEERRFKDLVAENHGVGVRREGFGDNVLPVQLRLTNPLIHDFKGKPYRDAKYEDLLRQAQDEGRDGAVFLNTVDGGPVDNVYVVFDAAQVRSRFAKFNPADAPLGRRPVPEFAQLNSELTQVTKQLDDAMRQHLASRRTMLARRTSGQPAFDLIERHNALGDEIQTLQETQRAIIERLRGVEATVNDDTIDIMASFTPLVLPLGLTSALTAWEANFGGQQ